MKKFLLVICLLLLVCPTMVSAKEKEKVNVYIFHGNGCPHCAKALEFFDSIKEEYGKYYTLKKYETWTSFSAKNNLKIMYEVAEKYDVDTEQLGVPFIIVGDKVFRGYTESYDEEIKQAIVDAYNDDNYEDKVKPIINSMKNNVLSVVAIAGGTSLGLVGLVVINILVRKNVKKEDITD